MIAVGEIRDRATAEVAFQASLTGHLVLSTFHAGSAAGAIGRLADMGIEPYLLRSGLLAVVSQRLVRTLCDCARRRRRPAGPARPAGRAGARVAVGCERCGGTGYRGRMVLAEMLEPEPARPRAAPSSPGPTSGRSKRAAVRRRDGRPLASAPAQAVEAGLTSPAEVRRVLGRPPSPRPKARTALTRRPPPCFPASFLPVP